MRPRPKEGCCPGGAAWPLFTVEVTRQKTASDWGWCLKGQPAPTPPRELFSGSRWGQRRSKSSDAPGAHRDPCSDPGLATHLQVGSRVRGVGPVAAPGAGRRHSGLSDQLPHPDLRTEPLPKPWAQLHRGWAPARFSSGRRESSPAVQPWPATLPRLSLTQIVYLLCRMQPKLLLKICDALPIGSQSCI